MKTVERLSVARDFTDTPGPRSPDEGPYSGKEFLDKHLAPKFQSAMNQKGIVLVDLDDTEGFASSFLESAFGGLARQFGPAIVEKFLRINSDEEPYLIDEVWKYIREAEK